MSNAGDFIIDNGVLKKYVGPGGDVVIPEGVSQIGTKAFFRCVSVTTVVIPEGVTDIDSEAFVLCKNLKTVQIPESVVRFGKRAFGWCANFAAVRIPKSLKTISEEAFIYCDKMTEVIIPEGVENIEKCAFSLCTSLHSISLPGSVTNVGKDALPHVKYLKLKRWIKGLGQAVRQETLREIEIEDPSRVPVQFKPLIVHKDLESGDGSDTLRDFTIKDGVLIDYKGNDGEVVIPAGVTEIGRGAFQHCACLISVIIPEGVSRISESAFADCEKLNHVVLPKSLVSIGDRAFQQCGSLNKVIISDHVTAIGNLAFASCVGLKDIVISDGVRTIGSSAFAWCNSLTDVVIPEGVQKLGSSVFWNCKNLKSVTIPESAKELGTEIFKSCSCVVRCRRFSPQLAEAMKDCDEFNTFLLLYTEDNISQIPAHLRRRALLGFVKEKNVDMNSDQAKSYLEYAKKNSGKMVDLAYKYPELLTFLIENQLIKAADVDSYIAEAEKNGNTEQKAHLLEYQNRIGLEKVKKVREKKERIKEEYLDTLSERMTKRDPSNGIEGITFVVTGKLWPWKSRDEIKEYLESYGASLGGSVNKKTDYLVVSEPKSQSEKTKKAEALGVQVISEAGFNDMIGKRYKDAAHVSVPKWIRTIPEAAFVRCKSMTDVSIPEGVTIIGDKAFEDCKSLKHVELPEGLTEIGEEAFHNCVGIESLTLPASITRIGKGAFRECGEISFTYGRSELRDIVYESSFNISDNSVLLRYVGPGGDVVIPKGINGFFLFPFSPSYGSQSQVTGITLPESMTVISSSAFLGCSKLERVVIPESVRRIEKAAFMSCAKLAEIKLPERLDELGTEAFSCCNSLTSVVIPETVTVLEEGVFSNCANLEQVMLPSSITEIKPRAFSGCKKLRSLILPEGLRKIGANAFTGCDCLAEINIPENVIEIGREAFGGCDSLKQVIIPDSVTKIGDYCFANCANLTIHAAAGSYAEKYAKEHGIPFAAG